MDKSSARVHVLPRLSPCFFRKPSENIALISRVEVKASLPSTARQRFWWVNQNQTFEQEQRGGYLWSLKRKANGHRNAFYEFMREVAPGNIVFSFKDALIQAIGVATDFCFEAPKPADFGAAGKHWHDVGWKVPVQWTRLTHRVRPVEHMDTIGPLRLNGHGLQSVYLTEIPELMAFELARLIGPPERELIRGQRTNEIAALVGGRAKAELIEWEDHLERQIIESPDIHETERDSLVKARRGQGRFRENVLRIEQRCRVTKVDRREHLVASHCKPWRDCLGAAERLDGENGLMLTPTIDHLFDRGFITFRNSGDLLVSPSADRRSLARMGIDVDGGLNVGGFSDGQKPYLEFHREQVFLESAIA